MANSIQYDYKILDRYSGPLGKIARMTDKFKHSAEIASRKVKKMQVQMGKMGETAKSVGSDLSLKVTAPISLIGGMALKSAAELETLTTSFVSLLGSSEKAGDMVKKLTDFTAKTPFQLEGVGKSAKQLLSFGVKQDKLIDRLKMLGDISAGANIPLSDMSAIFGKIKAKGKAMTEEILQLSDRGIPIIDLLSKKYKISKAAVFEMASKSKISFKMITASMRDMTSKGGIYFDQMGKQSETMFGIWSTVKDNMSLLLGDIGVVIADVFGVKDVGKSLISAMQNLRKWIINVKETNPFLIKTAFLLTALAAASGPAIVALGIMATTVGALTWPIVAIVAAIAGVVGAFIYWIKTSNPLLDRLKSIGSNVWGIVTSFLGFFGISTKGSDIMAGLAAEFNSLGLIINLILAPIDLLLISLRTILEVVGNIVTMNFGAAFESLKGGFSKFAAVFGFGDETSKSASGAATSAAQTKAAQQNVNVGGTIKVAAEPGTKVTSATPDLNMGPNMGMVY